MGEWYDDWQQRAESLPPPLKQVVMHCLEKGRENVDNHCECACRKCIELSYWWAAQEILKMHAGNRFGSPYGILEWFKRMFATCDAMIGWSLKYHSQETEDKEKAIREEILSVFRQELERGEQAHGMAQI